MDSLIGTTTLKKDKTNRETTDNRLTKDVYVVAVAELYEGK